MRVKQTDAQNLTIRSWKTCVKTELKGEEMDEMRSSTHGLDGNVEAGTAWTRLGYGLGYIFKHIGTTPRSQ